MGSLNPPALPGKGEGAGERRAVPLNRNGEGQAIGVTLQLSLKPVQPRRRTNTNKPL